MGSSGKTVADIRQELSIGTLRKNPALGAEDKIQEAMAFRREMAAMKIMDQSVSEMDTGAIQAENNRLKAEIEQKELKRQTEGDKQKDSEWQGYLIQRMETLEKALAEQQQAMTEAQMNALREQLNMLAGELQRVQAQPNQPASPVAVLKQQIEEYKSLMEIVQPASAPPTRTDPSLAAWKLRAEFDQERWKQEREDRHTERIEEMRLQQSLTERELALKEEHYNRMDRFMTDTAPKVLDTLRSVVQQFTAKNGGEVAPPPTVAAQVVPVLPADTQSLICSKCGTTVYYREGWPGVICNGCGTMYTEKGEDTSPRPSPDSGSQELSGEASIA